MGKRSNELVEEVAEVDADARAERKAAKKAKKLAVASEVGLEVEEQDEKAAKKLKKKAIEPVIEEENVEATALAAKKTAKKAKKMVGTVTEEEDAEAAALAAKKAAKKAKKAVEPVVGEEEDAEASALAAKKAAKKAKKAAAALAVAEDTPKASKKDADVLMTPEKVEPPKDTVDDEEWKDNTYKCIDCSEDWVDTADDQQFRYDKGFAETPKRCKDCRWAKKVRMEGGDPTAKGKGKNKGGKSGGDENTVFVRGLPFSCTEEALNKDFSECGEIASLRMPLNDEGNSRGIAFIKFTSKEGMDKALAFNETDYGGRTIFCSDAAIKPDGKGKGKDGKGKGKDGKDGKGKGKKGKSKGKGKASSDAFAKNTGAMVESTGKKTSFADSDDE